MSKTCWGREWRVLVPVGEVVTYAEWTETQVSGSKHAENRMSRTSWAGPYLRGPSVRGSRGGTGATPNSDPQLPPRPPPRVSHVVLWTHAPVDPEWRSLHGTNLEVPKLREARRENGVIVTPSIALPPPLPPQPKSWICPDPHPPPISVSGSNL